MGTNNASWIADRNSTCFKYYHVAAPSLSVFLSPISTFDPLKTAPCLPWSLGNVLNAGSFLPGEALRASTFCWLSLSVW